jgi:hypothetical protein
MRGGDVTRSVFYAALGAWTRAEGPAKFDAWLVLRAIEDATAPCSRCNDTGTTESGYGPEGWHDGEACDCSPEDRVTDDDIDAAIEVDERCNVRCKATGALYAAGKPAVRLINKVRAGVVAKREEAAA